MDKLLELISEGPNPRYTMKAAVLERYQDILRARQLMRTWADIADALDMDRGRWKDVATTFHRVAAGVKAGKLMPGKTSAGILRPAQSSSSNASGETSSTDTETPSRIRRVGPQ